MEGKEQHRLLLHNRFDAPVELWIEPWGDNAVLAPNSSYSVLGDGPVGGALELDLQSDSFTVYGWSGSTLTIFDDQQNVVWQSSVPVP